MNRKTKVRIYNTAVVALLLCGIIYVVSKFVHLGSVEFTDNAYVHQHITPIDSRVQGLTKEIRFDEYTPVHKGDTLVIIEDTEFRLRVAQAEAALTTACAGQRASATSVETVQSNIGVNDAAIAECRVQLDNARREDERYGRLLERHSVTQQQYDNVHTAYLAAQARYEQLTRSRRSTSLVKSEQSHRLEQNDAGIRVAEAALASIPRSPWWPPAAMGAVPCVVVSARLPTGGTLWVCAPLGHAFALQRCWRSSSCGRRTRPAPGFSSRASSPANCRPLVQADSGCKRMAAAARPLGSWSRSLPRAT